MSNSPGTGTAYSSSQHAENGLLSGLFAVFQGIHMGVRLFEEGGDTSPLLREDRRTGRPVAADQLVADFHSDAILVEESIQRQLDAVVVFHGFENYSKFVAAQAAKEICNTEAFTQEFGKFLQHGIADVMPEFVIDLLEIVEVDHHQGEGLARSLGPGQALLGMLEESPSIGDSRQ